MRVLGRVLVTHGITPFKLLISMYFSISHADSGCFLGLYLAAVRITRACASGSFPGTPETTEEAGDFDLSSFEGVTALEVLTKRLPTICHSRAVPGYPFWWFA